jgi:PmbA protein
MNTKEKLELAHWAVDQAMHYGASEAAADIMRSRDVEVEIREAQVDRLKDATTNSLSLTVYANRKYSSNATSDLRKTSLDKFIAESVHMTGYLTEDEYRYLPEPKYYKGQQSADLKTFDDTYGGLTSKEREKIARAVEEAARARSDRLITCTAGFSDSVYDSVKVHSNGFEGSSQGTVFAAGAEATVRGDGEGRPSDWDWRVARFRKDLPSPDQMAYGAVDRALARIGQKKLQSGRYDAIIENRSAGRILGALYSPMRAASIQQKRSYLEGLQGQRIASEKFTVIDDPFLPRGLGSRLYDDEGLATKRRVMIDRGILKEYYVDTYYGRKLGWEPTVGAPTNVVFEYGTRSLDEIVAATQRGILIDSFIGGNSSDITGEFSFGIMGHYIEDGKRVQAVNEMNIAGKLLEFFQQLDELGNDPYLSASMQSPSLVFRDVQFSGV